MKITRRLRLILLGVAAAVALTTALMFAPPVQRWIALRILAGRPGLRIDFSGLAVRPGSVTVRQLRWAWPGGRLTLASGAADLSLWDLLVHRRLIVRDARMSGLVVDLRHAPGAAGGSVPAAAAASPTWIERLPAIGGLAGRAARLKLPPGVELDRWQVDGVVRWPGGKRGAGERVEVHVEGGHLVAGASAGLEFNALAHTPDPKAPVETIEVHGSLTAEIGRQGELDRLGLHFNSRALGSKQAAPAEIQVYAGLARTAQGESYALLLTPPGAGPLLSLNADFVKRTAELSGAWEVGANDRQIAPFTFGWPLPEFSASGEGRFDIRPAVRAAHLTGQLSGHFSHLEAIDHRLRPLGALTIGTDFDIDFDSAGVRIAELLARVNGRKPLLVLQSLQPFAVNLGSLEVTAAEKNKGLLRASLEGVPVAWLTPWMGPELKVRGDAITGILDISLRGDQVRLRTSTPLTVQGAGISHSGRVWLPPCDLRLEAEAEHSPTLTRVGLTNLTMTTPAGDRLVLSGEYRRRRGSAAGETVRAELTGSLPTLLAPDFPVGPVKVQGALELSRTGRKYLIDRLTAAITGAEDRTVAAVKAEEPFVVDAAQWLVYPASGQPGRFLDVKIGRLPLGDLGRHLGRVAIKGELMPVELAVAATGAGLHAGAEAPWRIEHLSATVDGEPWLNDLTVQLDGGADYSADGLDVKLNSMQAVTAAGANLASTEGSAKVQVVSGQLQVAGRVSSEVAVAALAGQPLAAGLTRIDRGKLSGEATFTYDGNLLSKGRVTLNGLVSPQTGGPLPVANLSFRAGLARDGEFAIQAPLLIDRAGERSDLTLAATFRPTPDGRAVDARLTSGNLVIDDVAALVQSLTAGGAPAAVANGPAVDSGPVWKGLTGTVTLDAGSVLWGRRTSLTGLTGRLVIEPARLNLEQVKGKVGAHGTIEGSGQLRYAAGQDAPYGLGLDFAVNDLDVTPYFRAAAPGHPPALEGLFDLHGHADGKGRTLAALLAHAGGGVVLQSRKGVFRGLQQPPNPPRSGFVGSATRMRGNLGERVENLAPGGNVTAELARMFANLTFDQLTVHVSRDANHEFKLTDFSLVSPTVRLKGSGLIAADGGHPALQRPLHLQVNMSVTGAVEHTIARAKLPILSGRRDELGYMKLRDPFVIGGTPAAPDAGQLYSMLSRSLLDILLP